MPLGSRRLAPHALGSRSSAAMMAELAPSKAISSTFRIVYQTSVVPRSDVLAVRCPAERYWDSSLFGGVSFGGDKFSRFGLICGRKVIRHRDRDLAGRGPLGAAEENRNESDAFE